MAAWQQWPPCRQVCSLPLPETNLYEASDYAFMIRGRQGHTGQLSAHLPGHHCAAIIVSIAQVQCGNGVTYPTGSYFHELLPIVSQKSVPSGLNKDTRVASCMLAGDQLLNIITMTSFTCCPSLTTQWKSDSLCACCRAGRQLIYNLSQKHRNSLVLNYAIQRILQAGHEEEVANVGSSLASYFSVFHRLLTNRLKQVPQADAATLQNLAAELKVIWQCLRTKLEAATRDPDVVYMLIQAE